MSDPNTPPPFKIVDDDLIYVITGYNKINCLPDSRESSIANLRKYIIDMIGVSGVGFSREGPATVFSTAQEDNLIDINYSSSYPYTQKIATTGLNSKTENLIVKDYDTIWPYSGILYNTGLNAVVGNNVEIQFSTGTPAANKYGGVGGKYFSGIISTTGLNSRTENLIVRDFETSWPYSGIIYNTGLNARIGNNMEIQFSTSTPAANKYGGVGGKYTSGIISTTGLNSRTENLIVRDFETDWPYSGVIYNTGLNAVVGNNMEIQFSTSTPAANKYGRVGGKYTSGIVSTTGLNARSENLIVRDFERAWPYSGVIYNTGLNARVGNNMEIQFSTDTPADDKYGGVGGKYTSGIISTTGLNSRTENLIVRDFETDWPYSGVIYNTGLNARAGNLIQIQYQSSSPAGGIYGGTEGKYKSGIISTTGLNMIDGSNIGYTIGTSFPHKYTIFTVDQARTSTDPITFINNSANTISTTSGYIDPAMVIDYSPLYTSKPGENINLISSFKFLTDDSGDNDWYVSFTMPLASTMKIKELIPVSGVSYSTTANSCYMTTRSVYNPETDDYINVPYCQTTFKTITDPNPSDLSGWTPVSAAITAKSFYFSILCSGGSSSEFAKGTLTFTNPSGAACYTANGGETYNFGASFIKEAYRPSGYELDRLNPMEIEFFQQLSINSNTINNYNATSPKFNISNFGYTRTYRKLIGYGDLCIGDACTYNATPVYRYYTATAYGPASFTIGKRSFRTTNVS
jgi:hypothetical protein